MRYLNRAGLTGFITAFIFLIVYAGPLQAQNIVVTNTNDQGTGSLRWAIELANSVEGESIVSFNIPGEPTEIHTILPVTSLPGITNSTILDATTQPGYSTGNPKIVLDGSEVSAGSGIRITGNSSVVRGFSIVGFQGSQQGQGNGIFIDGGGDGTGGGHKIEANFLGILPDGSPKGNTSTGIDILRSAGNVIGGRTAAQRNVISGNYEGVGLRGADINQVEGNFIGTNPAGDEAVGNATNVIIWGASGNRIGGLQEGSGNVISGATNMGIRLLADYGDSSENNLIQGNLIGTTADGISALPNSDGIVLNSLADNNIIGDESESGRNIISGNQLYGIVFSGSSSSLPQITGNQVIGNYIGLNSNGNALGNQIGIVSFENVGENNIGVPSKAGNIISGNTVSGIRILDGTGLKIQNNFIGTSPEGLSAIPNSSYGIEIGGIENLIGGSSADARNIISGNGSNGIRIVNFQGFDGSASNNKVQGNYIGIAADGVTAVANEQAGILILSGSENIVGGTNSGERNVISGNNGSGIVIGGIAATGNSIFGNYIGVNPEGTSAIGNEDYGVFINGSSGNIVGGSGAGQRNIISGNNGSGVGISATSSTGNTISGNYIGLDASGSYGIGNGLLGITVMHAPGNQIVENVISHNGQRQNTSGIAIQGSDATDNQIRGNKIGTNADGTLAVGNNGMGIGISSGNTVIGGSSTADGNII